MSATLPNIAGYSFDQAPDLTDAVDARERLTRAPSKPS